MSRTNALTLLGLLALAGSGAGLAGLAASPAPALPASSIVEPGTFEIDSVHSSIVFKIAHNGVSNFYGRFNNVSGTFKSDSTSPESSSLDVSVKADSVDTHNTKREAHLSGPEFFNAKQFPSITFKSTGVTKGSDGKFSLSGDMTLLGVTKPVTGSLEFTGQKTGPKGSIAGVEAIVKIKRSDFGMTTYIKEGALGDEVTLTVALEGGKK
ncbi:MAG: YceI family protein [Planctomycetota bacterium]